MIAQTWADDLGFPVWNVCRFVWPKWQDGLQVPFPLECFLSPLYPVLLALAEVHCYRPNQHK